MRNYFVFERVNLKVCLLTRRWKWKLAVSHRVANQLLDAEIVYPFDICLVYRELGRYSNAEKFEFIQI